MDLVLSLSIEKLEMKAEHGIVKSNHEDWLQNANADLLEIFNQSDVDKKIEAIKKTHEISVDNLDIFYDAGLYYVIQEETHYPLNDQDKINLPGYVITVHLRNTSQINALSMDARYSEDLIDFDHLMADPDPAHQTLMDPYFSSAIETKQNTLEHSIDLPHMVFEDRQDRQQIERDRGEFYPPLARASHAREAHNILNILGIHEQADGFFKSPDFSSEQTFSEGSAPMGILDKMYEDTRRRHHDDAGDDQLEQKINIKKTFRSRLGYLKKAIIGS